MPNETPKRLAPSKETVRQVAARSGNLCAFAARDECDHPIINDRDLFVVQLCHIEAAEPGGARFNPDMTNEQRRAPENLMFLCLNHHIETNDEQNWSTERLRELKEIHEQKYREKEPQLDERTIIDITKAVAFGQPQNAVRFGRFVDGELTPDEHLATLNEMILPRLSRLRELAPPTRDLLLVILDRGTPAAGGDVGIPLEELEQVTGLDPEEILPHIRTMQRYKIAYMTEEFDEYDRRQWWAVTDLLDVWRFWESLKDFCKSEDIKLAQFVRDLRFDLLDD